MITLLRSFFNTRPARNQLQSKGILKQRVFACDLGEHLSNTQQDIPKILLICTQFIEKHGIVDGIYRHTGLQSNIQKLRNAFDEEKFAEIDILKFEDWETTDNSYLHEAGEAPAAA